MTIPGSGTRPPIVLPPTFFQPVIYYNSPVSINPAGNGELLIGYLDGHVYSFNPALGSTTLLEDLQLPETVTDGESVDRTGMLFYVGGFLNNRIAIYDSEGSDFTATATWESDTAVPVAPASALIESSIWDFDLPEQTKILDQFIVVCDLPENNDSVTVSYQVDQSGTWVVPQDADGNSLTVTSTATGLRTVIPVSLPTNTVRFTTLQFRTAISQGLDLSGEINPLKVYSVTAQARVPDFSETWEVLIRLQNESPGQRTPNRQVRGNNIRNRLWTLARGKDVTTFVDRYIGQRPEDFETYAVTIEGIDDFIDRDGEGKARVQLRRVLTSGDQA